MTAAPAVMSAPTSGGEHRMAADNEMIHVVDASGREQYITVAHIVSVIFTTSGTHQATITLTTARAGGTVTIRDAHATHLKRWLEERATEVATATPPPDQPEGSV